MDIMGVDVVGKIKEIYNIIFNKAAVKHNKNRYSAAETNRMTGAWSPTNNNINDLLLTANAKIRSRVRQLVRDFPYFARAVNVLTDYTVGEGIKFQSRLKLDDGSFNKILNTKIEDAFKFWNDEADISGKLSYYEMMRLSKRQDVEVGEFLIVKRIGTSY